LDKNTKKTKKMVKSLKHIFTYDKSYFVEPRMVLRSRAENGRERQGKARISWD
jgi:hypothetical protein